MQYNLWVALLVPLCSGMVVWEYLRPLALSWYQTNPIVSKFLLISLATALGIRNFGLGILGTIAAACFIIGCLVILTIHLVYRIGVRCRRCHRSAGFIWARVRFCPLCGYPVDRRTSPPSPS